MEARQGKLVVLVLTAILASGAPPVSAQAGGASGHLTLNGARAELHHSYASAQAGFFDKTTEDIRILLSDVPLDDEARGDIFALIGLARAGKVRAVEVVIDAAGQPVSGALFARSFEGMISVSGVHRFLERERSRTRIKGRLWMDRESTFAGVTFQYDAAFEARIPRPPTPEELAAELANPAAAAATAHLAAVIRGDYESFLATLAGPSAASYRGGDGRARFESIRLETPADSHVVRLIPQGPTRATATIEGSRGTIAIEFVLELTAEDGGWRVAGFP